ncbi:MAG: Glu/Leu/Phe/Val dehydrogenase [Candidatus Liptonbacteria bacterium]|nr:Glu/Leu/Phe/Val dehydrogenase [Candidatus Liptonbacteria bacterium]
MKNINLAKLPEFNNHELVVVGVDAPSGLRSFIAIHNTNLGPAVGGTRYWQYHSEQAALSDALRLSRAMTYKCALVGVPYGGGKGVIIAHRNNPKKKRFLGAYIKRVNLLGGNFYTGEDVGLNGDDVAFMERRSRFVIGRQKLGGSPAPWAALGVFAAIQGAFESLFGGPAVGGRSFALKGIGKVGSILCRLLYERGARIIAADINPERVRWVRRHFRGVKIVSPAEIHRQKVDVFVPCALGGDLNKGTIRELHSQIVCGGANNQLTSSEDGVRLHERGVLYIPDYLAGAGGLINVVAELDRRGYSRKRVLRKVKAIRGTAKKIIKLSRRYNRPTSEIADGLAEKIFLKRAKINL